MNDTENVQRAQKSLWDETNLRVSLETEPDFEGLLRVQLDSGLQKQGDFRKLSGLDLKL